MGFAAGDGNGGADFSVVFDWNEIRKFSAFLGFYFSDPVGKESRILLLLLLYPVLFGMFRLLASLAPSFEHMSITKTQANQYHVVPWVFRPLVIVFSPF